MRLRSSLIILLRFRLAIAATLAVALAASPAWAVVYMPNTPESTVIQNGQQIGSAVGLGQITGIGPDGSSHYSASAFVAPAAFGIVPTTLGSKLFQAGYGVRTPIGGQLPSTVDGQVGGGTGYITDVATFFDPTYYGASILATAVGDPNAVNTAPGDSGGIVTIASGSLSQPGLPIGVLDASINIPNDRSKGMFTRLDELSVQAFIRTYTSLPGDWAITAAHAVKGVTPQYYYLNGQQYQIDQAFYDTRWQGNFSTPDGFHPDIAVFSYSAVPEPSAGAIVLFSVFGFLSRRGRRVDSRGL